MKVKVWFALTLLVVCTAAAAQDAQKQAPPSKEMQEQMAAWMKYATPGDAHKALNAMIGTFDAKITMWSGPGAPAMNSNGTSINEWILGGRYVQEKFEGTFMGMPFSGVGLTGYDNAKKQYFGTWIDNMGTGIMTSNGSSADGKSYSFKTMMTDPMTGKDQAGEEKVTVADIDHHTFEMWGPGPDGKLMKMMEIAYTRKK